MTCLKKSVLALAAWGLLAAISPSFARAQVSYPPQGAVASPPPPVVTYAAPAPVVTYSAPAPVVDTASVYYSYASPVATYAPGVVAYSAPLAPVRVLPARYSFYQPAVVAPVYASQVYSSPVYSSTYYRGPSGRRVYNYTDYGPYTYPYAYGSNYYTPGYFRY